MEPDKYADHILSHNRHLNKEGKKFFVPAKSTKESHRLMKEVLCTKYGFHTIMINGDGIHVYAPDGRMYDQYNKIKILLIFYRKYVCSNQFINLVEIMFLPRSYSIIKHQFLSFSLKKWDITLEFV